jgi:hypothetical protein
MKRVFEFVCKRLLILLVLTTFFYIFFVSAQVPTLHTIQGYIFSSGSTQAPSGTTVKINATTTGSYITIQTSGPPGYSGFYSTAINALDNEVVIVYSLNSTTYGKRTIQLSSSPQTTRVNITLNQTRSEVNTDIISPANGANFDKFQVFNLTFNVTGIIGNNLGCNATILFGNPSIIGLTSSSNSTISLGDIAFGTNVSGLFELRALSEGTTTVTVTTICSSDSENFENQQSETITLNINNQPPQLHTLQGYVLNKDNMTQVPSGTNVTINATETGSYVVVQTSGPPGHSGFFSTTINARNGESVILLSNNGTYEGQATINLLASPQTTKVNISLNMRMTPDLTIIPSEIIFSDNSPIENVPVIINATIRNIGRGNAGNVVVQFFNGDPNLGGIQVGENQTIPLVSRSGGSVLANISFIPRLGRNNIFVLLDPPITTNGTIEEVNESNNQANNTLNVPSWQNFYGSLSSDVFLGDNSSMNLSIWFNRTSLVGNVFFVDSESEINWNSLQAMGRNSSGATTSNDFTEIDTLLNMTDFADLTSSLFTTNGNTPRRTMDFVVHNKLIQNVPIVNSTNTTNFVTGILWDTMDSSDGEYSQSDEEDIVFVTEINRSGQGAYGIYDYEIKIPVKLREYNKLDSSNIFIYFDLN